MKSLAYRHVTTAVLLAAVATVGLWWVLSGRWSIPPWLLCWLIAINVTAFIYYGYDKSIAASKRMRVPESALHGISIAGGSLGAYLGMRVFRHKTIKGSFRFFFWLIVVVQIVLVTWMVYLTYF